MPAWLRLGFDIMGGGGAALTGYFLTTNERKSIKIQLLQQITTHEKFLPLGNVANAISDN